MLDKNDKYVQLQGPFKKNEELISIIKEKFKGNVGYISRIGIQSRYQTKVMINGEEFIIGLSGMLDIRNVKITSCYFLHDVSDLTIIDCIIEQKEGSMIG